ncbi:MAG TPA: ornithine cyclodeaminase family protein [Vicinamibacterales bacterium]|nr:ornithine cyclodeaminase family protein [Vicinamibacterales bacterium]
MSRDTLVLTARDVEALLDVRTCIDAVEQALTLHEAGQSLKPASLGLTLPGGSLHAKVAGLTIDGRSYVAAKVNVNLPGNPAHRGLPTIQGVLALFDVDVGSPLALMDSIVITSIRTGAVAAVAARHLALPEADSATIVGCGEQGKIQLRAIAAVRCIRRAWAIDIDRGKAAQFARGMSHALGIEVVETDDLPGAVSRSQICVTCTTSHQAILAPEVLHPGLFVAAIGADNPHKQELDPQVLSRARVVVDSLDACADGGELHHAIDAGLMTRDDVHAELSAVVAGHAPGRSTAGEMFVFDSTGTALQDVAAAVVVFTGAVASGRGRPVPLGTG